MKRLFYIGVISLGIISCFIKGPKQAVIPIDKRPGLPNFIISDFKNLWGNIKENVQIENHNGKLSISINGVIEVVEYLLFASGPIEEEQYIENGSNIVRQLITNAPEKAQEFLANPYNLQEILYKIKKTQGFSVDYLDRFLINWEKNIIEIEMDVTLVNGIKLKGLKEEICNRQVQFFQLLATC
ncbi:hypothetical protein [Xanthovirga aplysinae]|uniref:hypothetical protein n=1 Tax=Xanthovirga aplysinae TaxID=2529853 RepID=UPI0012BC6F32|nr:hypothetical protein [Xanthovirga aplysinae]MTI30539.1 hypothetical protein [Xanthovirga aplysinae]